MVREVRTYGELPYRLARQVQRRHHHRGTRDRYLTHHFGWSMVRRSQYDRNNARTSVTVPSNSSRSVFGRGAPDLSQSQTSHRQVCGQRPGSDSEHAAHRHMSWTSARVTMSPAL